jgi:hypothetical protein
MPNQQSRNRHKQDEHVMDLSLKNDQQMLRDTFARFLDEHSSMERVRKAIATRGFDGAPGLPRWRGRGERNP